MSYYYKHNDKDIGPMEERTVIAKLIDGEINSRSLIKDHYDGKYQMLQNTDFNAILEHLTSRWRYNIGALKREFVYLMISLAIWLLPLLTYLGGLFNSSVRSILLHYGVMGIFGFFSFAGFFSSCYFLWVFAYRLWRVVPKSMYHVTPGWRIMLTFIPFFRFGWNYCMWIPLASKLRALSNYSIKTGRTAAYFYSSGVIFLTASIYSVAVLPWSYSLLNGKIHDALWENILGWIFLALLITSFVVTVSSFVVMTYKMKNAALAILRHRYAYNICTKTHRSPFLETTLKRQRHYDKVHRWGHGLGIGGVLAGWPLLLVGIPVLILFIVGSCRYERSRRKLESFGMPSSLMGLYSYSNSSDNAMGDVRDILEKPTTDQLKRIFAHTSIAVGADWQKNYGEVLSPGDITALQKVNALLEEQMVDSREKQQWDNFAYYTEKYCSFIVWQLNSPVPAVFGEAEKSLTRLTALLQDIKIPLKEAESRVADALMVLQGGLLRFYCKQFVVNNLIAEQRFDDAPLPFPPPDVPGDFWLHVYKLTPFMYFSKEDIYEAVLQICRVVNEKGWPGEKEMSDYCNATFVLDEKFYLQQQSMFGKAKDIDTVLQNLILKFRRKNAE